MDEQKEQANNPPETPELPAGVDPQDSAPQTPSVDEQNPFKIHFPSEEDRRREAALQAAHADQQVLLNLARQHPQVAALLAEVEKLREQVAKKSKK